jgi:hypothetical protein
MRKRGLPATFEGSQQQMAKSPSGKLAGPAKGMQAIQLNPIQEGIMMMMKASGMALAILGMMGASAAMAQSGGNGYGDSIDLMQPALIPLESRTLKLTMSPQAVVGINVLAYDTFGTDPTLSGVGGAILATTVDRRMRLSSASLASSLVSAGNLQADGRPGRVTTTGGLRWMLLSDDFTNTGGSITLSNWTVDAVSRRLLVDVDGANGVGHHDDVAFFSLGQMTVEGGVGDYVNGQTTFASLGITGRGAELLVGALGLTSDGASVIPHISSLGTLTVGVAMTAVPEPEGLALALGGLLSLGWLRARRSPVTSA